MSPQVARRFLLLRRGQLEALHVRDVCCRWEMLFPKMSHHEDKGTPFRLQ